MLRLAVPIVIAEVGWIIMSLVDLAMIGRVGPDAIAAVSIGSAIFHVFAIVAEGLFLGLDTLVSQAYGGGRLDDCHRSMFAGVHFSLPFSLLLIVMVWATVPLVPLVGIGPAVSEQVGHFLVAMSWGFPALLCFFVLRRYLQAIHLVKIIPFALISANLVNLLGNYVLIYGKWGLPAMGAQGSGLSTSIARYYMLAVLVAYLVWQNRKQHFHLGRFAWGIERRLISTMVRLGLPAAGQIALEVGVFSASTLIAGRLGAIVVSGHQIALSMASFTFMATVGLSSATAVRVGNAVGRNDADGANAAGWTGVALSAVFMLTAAFVFWTIPEYLVAGFTNDPNVAAVGIALLSIAAVFQFFDGLQVTVIGALRGSGDTRTPMLINILGWWMFGLPLGTYLCFSRGWGARGIWTGLCAGLILIGTLLAVAWRSRVRRLREQAVQVPTVLSYESLNP